MPASHLVRGERGHLSNLGPRVTLPVRRSPGADELEVASMLVVYRVRTGPFAHCHLPVQTY